MMSSDLWGIRCDVYCTDAVNDVSMNVTKEHHICSCHLYQSYSIQNSYDFGLIQFELFCSTHSSLESVRKNLVFEVSNLSNHGFRHGSSDSYVGSTLFAQLILFEDTCEFVFVTSVSAE